MFFSNSNRAIQILSSLPDFVMAPHPSINNLCRFWFNEKVKYYWKADSLDAESGV